MRPKWGDVEPPDRRNCCAVQLAGRRVARTIFREVDAAKAMTELERAQKAFQEKRERLKALRPAREAEDAKAK